MVFQVQHSTIVLQIVEGLSRKWGVSVNPFHLNVYYQQVQQHQSNTYVPFVYLLPVYRKQCQ